MAISISTHILDTARGCPAAGVTVHLARRGGDGTWHEVASAVTDADGRIADWSPEPVLNSGVYRLNFEVGVYFGAQGISGFYGSIPIVFNAEHPDQHYHVPLLLSPFSYSTYRGS